MMWMTYHIDYVATASSTCLDSKPVHYYDISFFGTELEALRHAQRTGADCAEIPPSGGHFTWIRAENAKGTPAWRSGGD